MGQESTKPSSTGLVDGDRVVTLGLVVVEEDGLVEIEQALSGPHSWVGWWLSKELGGQKSVEFISTRVSDDS